MVVWTDYQCPACKQFEKEIDSARLQLKDSLTVVYRYYPLAMHPLALHAAVAAECARNQGRFAQMHMALFQRNLVGDSLPTESLIQAANIPNAALFRACLSDSSGPAAKAVRLDMARGQTLRLGGTPGVQIGDHLATGAMFTTELVSALHDVGSIRLDSATLR
jgi:protein-disulfide isomerase